jgi:hypothetical protein
MPIDGKGGPILRGRGGPNLLPNPGRQSPICNRERMMLKTMRLTTSPTKPDETHARSLALCPRRIAGRIAGRPEAGVSHVRETGLSWTVDQTVPDRAVLISENGHCGAHAHEAKLLVEALLPGICVEDDLLWPADSSLSLTMMAVPKPRP